MPGGNETPDKIEVNLDLLCGLYTAFAVTLMHKDFLDKLVEHGNGQKQACEGSCFAPTVHIFESLVFVHALAVPGKVSGRNEDF